MSEADMQRQIDVLKEQQSMQTNAIKAALEARWAGGADTVDGWVKALDPHIETNPQTPLYEV